MTDSTHRYSPRGIAISTPVLWTTNMCERNHSEKSRKLSQKDIDSWKNSDPCKMKCCQSFSICCPRVQNHPTHSIKAHNTCKRSGNEWNGKQISQHRTDKGFRWSLLQKKNLNDGLNTDCDGYYWRKQKTQKTKAIHACTGPFNKHTRRSPCTIEIMLLSKKTSRHPSTIRYIPFKSNKNHEARHCTNC